MRKAASVKTLRNRLWTQFSAKRRKEDAQIRGDGELVRCCTCQVIKHWTEFHAGHFIPKEKPNKTLYFHSPNVHCQCYRCNRKLHGNYIAYTMFMIDTYGLKTTRELFNAQQTDIPFTKHLLYDIEKNMGAGSVATTGGKRYKKVND